MPELRWVVPLDGAPHASRVIVDRAGRVVVSTTRRFDSRSPRFPASFEQHGSGRDAVVVDHLPHRCYVVDPCGEVVWTASKLGAKGASPGGGIVAADRANDVITLDAGGAELARSATRVRDEDWSVIGWRGDEPVISARAGACWIEPYVYAIDDRRLSRYDAGGALVGDTAIPRDAFDVIARARPEVAALPGMFGFPSRYMLAATPDRRRLVASHWMHLGWVMSLRLDGTVDWVTLVHPACCNAVCVTAAGAMVHTSSCGGRVSFVSADGVVTRGHDISSARASVADHCGCAYTTTRDEIHAFDGGGRPAWTLDVPEVDVVAVHAGVLYAVSGDGRLELRAWTACEHHR